MMSRLRFPRTYWADRALLALLVAATAWLSLTLARGPGELAAIWVGNGILTGWLLSRRSAAWPGYIAVAFAAELPARMLAGDELGYAFAIALCNLVEAVGVALVVRRRVPDVRNPKAWLALGGIATGATLVACAVAGALAAMVSHYLHGQPFAEGWGRWFAAHVVGMVILATTTLVMQRKGPGLGLFTDPGRSGILAIDMALVVVAGVAVFTTPYPLLFLSYPPLLLVAVRHRFVGVALGVIALGLIGATATSLGYGPLVAQGLGREGRIVMLQLYLGGACLMTIPMCLAVIERRRLAARLEDSRLELERLSRVDALTGLANRRQFDERLDLALKRLQRHRVPLALMCLDVDHFKTINDTWGHAAGDVVLKAVASRLRASVRETDLVARQGGDEFAILIEDAAPGSAEAVAGKVIEAAREPVVANGRAIPISTSIGIAYAHGAVEAGALLEQADAALYAAKKAGRGRYHVAAVDWL